MDGMKAYGRGMVIAIAILPLCVPASRAASDRLQSHASADLVTIEKGMSGPYIGRAFLVVNSIADWDTAMSALAGSNALEVTPPPPAPQGVDWSHEVVVLLAAGFTGYGVTLVLSPAGGGEVSLGAEWTPLGNDASWATPYHLVRTAKRGWLRTQTVVGDGVSGALPLMGPDDVPLPAESFTWGALKARYR